MHGFEVDQTSSETCGHNFAINMNFDNVRPENYDALVIPGGRAPEYLRLNKRVLKIARHFINADNPIASFYHVPQILAAVGGVENRVCSAYPAVKSELVRAGAKWRDANETFSNAYVDGNMVSASG